MAAILYLVSCILYCDKIKGGLVELVEWDPVIAIALNLSPSKHSSSVPATGSGSGSTSQHQLRLRRNLVQLLACRPPATGQPNIASFARPVVACHCLHCHIYDQLGEGSASDCACL